MSAFDTDEWKEASDAFNKAINQYQKEADQLWQALPHDDRLKLFCAVVKILAKAELDDKRSYRGVLYDAFEFDPGSYAPAQCAGFLDLHNSIHTFDDLKNIIKSFVEKRMDITKDNLDEQVVDYLTKKYYF